MTWEIRGVECDQDFCVRTNCRRQHVPVLRITGQCGDEGFVARDHGVREVGGHSCDPLVYEFIGHPVLQKILFEFRQDVAGLERAEQAAVGKPQDVVVQQRAEEHICVEEDREAHSMGGRRVAVVGSTTRVASPTLALASSARAS